MSNTCGVVECTCTVLDMTTNRNSVRLHHMTTNTRGECLCGRKVYRSHGLGDWIHEGSHSIWCDTLTVEEATRQADDAINATGGGYGAGSLIRG